MNILKNYLLSRWMEGYKDTQVVKVFKIIQHKNIDNQ